LKQTQKIVRSEALERCSGGKCRYPQCIWKSLWQSWL